MSLARALVGCKRVIDYAVKVRSRPLSPLACRVEMLLGDGLAACSITLLVGVTVCGWTREARDRKECLIVERLTSGTTKQWWCGRHTGSRVGVRARVCASVSLQPCHRAVCSKRGAYSVYNVIVGLGVHTKQHKTCLGTLFISTAHGKPLCLCISHILAPTLSLAIHTSRSACGPTSWALSPRG
jgi:hypothetical protein